MNNIYKTLEKIYYNINNILQNNLNITIAPNDVHLAMPWKMEKTENMNGESNELIKKCSGKCLLYLLIPLGTSPTPPFFIYQLLNQIYSE